MPLNHSFSITFCNTKLIVQLAVMILILLLLAFAALSTVVTPIIQDIIKIIDSTEFSPDEFLNHPFNTFQTQILDKITAHFQGENFASTVVVLVLVYFCFRFFICIPQLPLTKVLYNKMTTGYDIGLFNAFVETGFQNLLLSLILSAIYTILNIGLMIGFFALMRVTILGKVFFAIPLIILAFIALYSAKSAIFSQWMPEICASQTRNIFIGIKNSGSVTFKKFRKNFLCFCTLNTIWFAIFATTAIPTFGAITIIGLPTFIIMRAVLSLTLNFSYHHKKYYTDNGSTIYTPEKLF